MPRLVRRLAILIGLGGLATGVTPAVAQTWPGSWCQMPAAHHLPAGAPIGRDRDDIRVFYIKRSEVAGALRRLRDQSVVRLSRGEFRHLARDNDPAPARYLYLARAGVQTPLNMPERDFLPLAESAGYQVSDRGYPDGFKIVSLSMSGFVANRRRYAVLLASPERIPTVLVACLGGT